MAGPAGKRQPGMGPAECPGVFLRYVEVWRLCWYRLSLRDFLRDGTELEFVESGRIPVTISAVIEG